MITRLKGVVLDWAGTVVDYGSCAPAEAFVQLFLSRGIKVSITQVREPMGLNKKMHIQALCQMADVSEQWEKTYGRRWTSEDVDKLYAEFIPLQLACLKNYSQLIPGTLETFQEMRRRDLKVGTTTGYSSDMIGIVAQEAKKQGFEPDAIVCASDVKVGRPQPWMALLVAQKLEVYPMRSLVKIGDTLADLEEGLNAGMWTIGVAKTGNELGLIEDEVQRLSKNALSEGLEKAYQRLKRGGAHFVVDGIGDVIPVLDEINHRLEQGQKP